MATVAASGDGNAPVVEKRNGATVLNAGNIDATSPVTRAVLVSELADHDEANYDSVVAAQDGTGASTTDRAGVGKAVATGSLAYQPGTDAASNAAYVIRGFTEVLNGSGNLAIQTPGSDWSGAGNNNIFSVTSTRAVGSGNGSFNVYAVPSTELHPGRTKGGDAGSNINFVQATDGTTDATDDAATPTRSTPGELVYRDGGVTPFTDEYKASDSNE